MLTFSGNGKTEKMYNEIRGSGKEGPWDCWREQCVTVVFEEGLTEIDAGYLNAFWKVKEIKLPKSLRVIGKEAFDDCRELKKVKFPSKLKVIGERAFSNCALKKANLPKSVKEIGKYAFGNNQLREINWSDSIHYGQYVYSDNPTISKVTLSKGLKELPDTYMEDVRKVKKITLPESITKIPWRAFQNAKLKELILPSGVKKLEYSAFADAKIGKLVLNDGLESIGAEAFENAHIDEIIVPDTVKYFGNCAFHSCKVKRIVLPKNITWIPGGLFTDCDKLEEVVIQENVTDIGMNVFLNCRSLENITIQSEKLTKIHKNAFGDGTGFYNNVTIYVPKKCCAVYKKLFEETDMANRCRILPIEKESQPVENTQSGNASFAGKIWIVAGIFVVVLFGVFAVRKMKKKVED